MINVQVPISKPFCLESRYVTFVRTAPRSGIFKSPYSFAQSIMLHYTPHTNEWVSGPATTTIFLHHVYLHYILWNKLRPICGFCKCSSPDVPSQDFLKDRFFFLFRAFQTAFYSILRATSSQYSCAKQMSTLTLCSVYPIHLINWLPHAQHDEAAKYR